MLLKLATKWYNCICLAEHYTSIDLRLLLTYNLTLHTLWSYIHVHGVIVRRLATKGCELVCTDEMVYQNKHAAISSNYG